MIEIRNNQIISTNTTNLIMPALVLFHIKGTDRFQYYNIIEL